MFEFVDLFAGVGGFHAALKRLGGTGVQAAEIDRHASAVYQANWGLAPVRDVRTLAADPAALVPEHDVLVGGFPCQPFSKSGRQLGMAEERGTLVHDIVAILAARRPPVIMLENVRNIAGPRQRVVWEAVRSMLRETGYLIADEPLIFSPHLLPPELGGAPQVRERAYILGVYVGRAHAMRETNIEHVLRNEPYGGWDPQNWSLEDHVLLPEQRGDGHRATRLDASEESWINTWNGFLAHIGAEAKLPGFPLWEFEWKARRSTLAGLPDWKADFVRKNHDFYVEHRPQIDAWRRQFPQVSRFPTSRRKFEWQAQNSDRDLWKLLIQFRPSGIRVKRPTYAPALVAMAQTPIFGPRRRRLTPEETARLQGFDPASFTFAGQRPLLSYKQMGNAVNVGTAQFVFAKYVERNEAHIRRAGPGGERVVRAVESHWAPRGLAAPSS
ncbi:DNA (cytosine-5-)-methyltransferase [Phycicoccus sp. 3266]|uniref:DNA (cytosine-5-)-methyltransferase n=1 Tax=Phycicoccus sp. 3266 TaxID=2817751 RepID=UPI002862FCA2|nr:DNA (cytosine-5-)-methyltransferase [Phycicoccus sp. 3266]MDR6865261.1 DNA (cytosine-5)-methyltransferase 1 [Phycicoccus sp. 3266]